jgi:hypothetical protein
MADPKNRGGQKLGQEQSGQSEQKQGSTTQGARQRLDRDKQKDPRSNRDYARRQATNEQR